MSEEHTVEEPTDAFRVNPDVLFTINRQKYVHDDEYDLEEEDDGFHCSDCGWRALSLPMTGGADSIMDAVCPECGSEGVENKLSTHIDEVRGIYSDADKGDEGFMTYNRLQGEFEPPQDRLDEALNHLITNNSLYVVFENGQTLINVE